MSSAKYILVLMMAIAITTLAFAAPVKRQIDGDVDGKVESSPAQVPVHIPVNVGGDLGNIIGALNHTLD
ncbi:hypothetical protein BGZ89_010166 [Linnemannia elongata]|nr:hypothetical protein BGZ89_010166 [Linnemannia elongata]